MAITLVHTDAARCPASSAVLLSCRPTAARADAHVLQDGPVPISQATHHACNCQGILHGAAADAGTVPCADAWHSGAHLALALLVALGEKPIRLRGLLPKLSRSLAGYLLAPLKNLRQGEDESEPIVGLSPSLLASFLPLGVMMPLEEGGECAPASTSPLRGRVAIGFRLGLMGGSPPAMMS